MRAAVVRRPGPIETTPLVVETREPPWPGPGQVRLRVRACGVCHTDLHVAEGDLPPRRAGVVPGHQIVADVDALGDGADPALAGARVGVTWLAWTCGMCAACRRGEENLCPRARFTGYDTDGGFAEVAVADAGFVIPLPRDLAAEAAAPLLCAGVIGYRALRVAGVQSGERLGLYGFGASAHLAIQVARHWRCEVGVVTRGAGHQGLAEALGAAWVGEPGARPPEAFDRAVVFAPSGALVVEALRAVRPGGVVAINAVTMDAIPAMPYELLYGERTLRTVSHLTRADARAFIALAAEISLRAEIEVFGLVEVNEALRRLKRRELRAAAVLRP
ncbi:MAG: zinc-binding alcohol dehydrogenase family protein [Armatimonadota bacterium]|nr:zinc-binding alcohol dehydrogenase family protein [Armatimonadota bacterium]MDR7421973.1 zinc-binding alcohol dehydrogenase family protein [Armatimonadota bacterium]MDR7456956.1 zinc-binding alcohol dehydrogenase family protein [Armatimonadota bacterium]MDR7496479.1 zinc-binding alcohol dehydrogenase family protein [Armatimonadota bacterium]MDR7511572.1 zinc-binding alcohol dehydrogenase family protein [Armatimonadota bacterium]